MNICVTWRSLKSILLVALVSLLGACGGGGPGDSGGLAARVPALGVVSGTVATFASARANYSITNTGSGYTVTDLVGSEGTTNVPSTVQTLVFSDMTINLVMRQKASTISAADLKSLIELYIAYFNRVPDATGLAYWIDQFKSGQTLDQIGQQFYAAALQFSSVTGYTSSMTNADFVTLVYKNVLGRSSPDAAGLSYWTTSLANGSQTRGTLVKTILAAAHAYKGDPTYGPVADLLDNKATVANYFAVQQGISYTSATDSITKGMAIAAAVTSTNTAAAISQVLTVDSAPQNPIAGTWTGPWNSTASGDGGCTYTNNGSLTLLFSSNASSITGSATATGLQLRYVPSCAFAFNTTASGPLTGTLTGTSIAFQYALYLAETGETKTYRWSGTVKSNQLSASLVSTSGSGAMTGTSSSSGSNPVVVQGYSVSGTVNQWFTAVVGTASGGTPPYYFTLGTLRNGAPPLGMIVDLNGNLSGVPAVAGTYNFDVCAVDLTGNTACTSSSAVIKSTATSTVSTTTPGGPYYWANWSCQSSAACASLMGGVSGSAGPMCAQSDCTAWGNKYISNGYSCSTTATYTKTVTQTPTNGACFRSGVEF